jgi:hypothetical protein
MFLGAGDAGLNVPHDCGVMQGLLASHNLLRFNLLLLKARANTRQGKGAKLPGVGPSCIPWNGLA